MSLHPLVFPTVVVDISRWDLSYMGGPLISWSSPQSLTNEDDIVFQNQHDVCVSCRHER